MFVNTVSDGEQTTKSFTEINKHFLENRVPDKKMLYQTFDVESSHPCTIVPRIPAHPLYKYFNYTHLIVHALESPNYPRDHGISSEKLVHRGSICDRCATVITEDRRLVRRKRRGSAATCTFSPSSYKPCIS